MHNQESPVYQVAEFHVPPCRHDNLHFHYNAEVGGYVACVDCERVIDGPDGAHESLLWFGPTTTPYDWADDDNDWLDDWLDDGDEWDWL